MSCLKKFVLSVLFVCLTAGSVFAAGVDDIRFMTEEYPPFNMKGDDGVATGIAVDVLAEMFKRVGSSKTAKDVVFLTTRKLTTLIIELFTAHRSNEMKELLNLLPFKVLAALHESIRFSLEKQYGRMVSKPVQ